MTDLKQINRATSISLLLKASAIFLLSAQTASAEYCATGKVEGYECSGFIIKSCVSTVVDAARDGDGNVFHIRRCYPEVSEYSESKSLCWINTKTSGLGLLSKAADAAVFPDFLHKNDDGEYEKIDPEYLVFKCEKRS